MGTSGDMSTSNGYVKYHITVNQNSQNISGNKSNVSVYVRFWRTNSGYQTYGTGTCYCKINGTTYSASVSPSQKITNSGIDLFSKTLDIGHNNDGTKTLTCSAWISIDAPLSSSEQSYSQTLTRIPRTSQVSLSSTSVTMGNSVTINTNRASSSFKHALYVDKGSGWETIASSVNSSYSWTVPRNFANSVPKSTKLNMTIWCETYNGGSYIGVSSKGLTANVPSDMTPTVNSLTLTENVSGLNSKFGTFVQGKSKISGSISASGSYSSSIKSYSASINSQAFTSSSFTTNEISGSGSLSAKATVTDTRGRSASKTVTYSVAPYTAPKINAFSIVRADSSGVEDEQGTYALCTINAGITAVNDRNDKSFILKYKKTSDSNYTSIDITPNDSYIYNDTYLVSGIDINYEYDFVLEVTDYFSTTSKSERLSTAFTLVDYNASGHGMAIGRVSTRDALQVGLETDFNGDVTFYGQAKSWVSLYNNTSGTAGTVALSDSSANYSFLEIYFRDNSNNYGSIRVYSPDKKGVLLSTSRTSSGGSRGWIKSAYVSISGNAITFGKDKGQLTVIDNDVSAVSVTDIIWIYSVLGYK